MRHTRIIVTQEKKMGQATFLSNTRGSEPFPGAWREAGLSGPTVYLVCLVRATRETK